MLCEEIRPGQAPHQRKHQQLHITEGFTSDEKTQIQALDRTAPILPIRPGMPEKQTHDDKRNGTTSLFAALEVATGKVIDACYERHTNVEFLAFLKLVAKAYREGNCTSCATTTPLTSTPTSRPGWPRTPE